MPIIWFHACHVLRPVENIHEGRGVRGVLACAGVRTGRREACDVRLVMESLQVMPPLGPPMQLCWRGRRYRVLEIVDRWSYRGRWWSDCCLVGERRLYLRLLCIPEDRATRSMRRDAEQGRVMEVFCQDGMWTLSRLLD